MPDPEAEIKNGKAYVSQGDNEFIVDKQTIFVDTMNNVAYIPMLLGTLPSAALHAIREMETHYRRPCLEGETLSIRRRRLENGWLFAAVKPDGETAVVSQALEAL